MTSLLNFSQWTLPVPVALAGPAGGSVRQLEYYVLVVFNQIAGGGNVLSTPFIPF